MAATPYNPPFRGIWINVFSFPLEGRRTGEDMWEHKKVVKGILKAKSLQRMFVECN